MMPAATAHSASFGNPDEPAEGAVNVTNPKALIDPGPQDPSLAGNEPVFLNPPATDVNGMPQFWAFIQSCAQANPERRLGAADYPG
jgi:oxalate decarboxylase